MRISTRICAGQSTDDRVAAMLHLVVVLFRASMGIARRDMYLWCLRLDLPSTSERSVDFTHDCGPMRKVRFWRLLFASVASSESAKSPNAWDRLHDILVQCESAKLLLYRVLTFNV